MCSFAYLLPFFPLLVPTSGGPMIRLEDKALIGLTSYAKIREPIKKTEYPIEVQVFTSIFYYMDWISEITGITLPDCTDFMNSPRITPNKR